ncbi:MAG: prepilin-type N-terminal cleavage/methylation domain-containing protein [Desulfobulbaceae bacterium]|nr:prepilin-type N-terminal cleavage/methylation domain-containing protein [Desulfobulbaceae bacterium]
MTKITLKDIYRPFRATVLQVKNQKGLTLLELMIVVAIIGVLSAIAIPYYQGYIAEAAYKVTILNIQIIEKEITIFKIKNGCLPTDLMEVGLDNLLDPWDNPYVYTDHTGGEKKRQRSRQMA